MSEFVLEGRDHAARAESPFVLGFIEAMFFCEVSCFASSEWNDDETQDAIREGQSDGNLPSDAEYADIEPESLNSIREFCDQFQKDHAKLLKRAYRRAYDEIQAGRDLYFTRAGHGVGYWDREELKARGLGESLTEAAGNGEVNPSAEVAETGAIRVTVDLY